ncbi:hypothetical protein MG293_019227 [Ovis ammon polii]|uniref:Uncharacterized protein n=1 Tax=Ovis ammon polii TaxID=230172 RepID=A0AAD4Y0N6_OVIAM|nr:hypothetical protein MG293_019227 [Ovis ammon polii]KAI4550651.1 hypothetical protein MJT46_018158 [Ovis ammon polii x Ovis aries]
MKSVSQLCNCLSSHHQAFGPDAVRRQTSPGSSESREKQEEGPKAQRLSRTQRSHPQSPEKMAHGETLLFSRKKHLHKKKGLLEMDTVAAEMKASSTTEAEQ